MPAASFDQNQNATVITYRSVLAIPNGYDALDPLRSAGEQFVAQVNASAGDIRDERLPSYLAQHTGPTMFRAGATAHGASLNHKREYLAADRRLRQPAETIDLRHAPEIRVRFVGRELGQTMTAIAAADLATLAALVVDGNLADLAPEAFALATDRYLALNVLERTGMGAQYASKPRLDDPLAVGVDETAATRAAEAVLEGHKARAEMVATHARALQDYAAFLGHAYDMAADAVFDRMVGD